jgi:hypothetical protein
MAASAAANVGGMEATGLSEPVEARLLDIIKEGKCTRKELDQQTLKVQRQHVCLCVCLCICVCVCVCV